MHEYSITDFIQSPPLCHPSSTFSGLFQQRSNLINLNPSSGASASASVAAATAAATASPFDCCGSEELHPIKRHMDEGMQSLIEDGAPLPKRKVDKMSARLDKVHISSSANNNPNHIIWRKRQRHQETFEEIEQRLNDSSDDDRSDEDDNDDDMELLSSKRGKIERRKEDEQNLRLSKELKKFMRQAADEHRFLPPPSPMNALVPYVPPILPRMPTMEGRISELDENDAEWSSTTQSEESFGHVTFPTDDSRSSSVDESVDLSNDGKTANESPSESISTPLNIVELNDSANEDDAMDVDMEFS